jgi:hypothetical protein
VTARSKAWNVFARSNAGIVGSNSWMSVCVYFVSVLFCMQEAASWRADSPSKKSYRLCIGWRNWKKAVKIQQKVCRAIDILPRYIKLWGRREAFCLWKIFSCSLIFTELMAIASGLGRALSSLARKPVPQIRIPLRAWMFSVCVCAFFYVCVQVEALRRGDHPSKESYRLSLIKKLRKLNPMLQKREQRGGKKVIACPQI